MRLRHQLLENRGVEHLAADGHPFSEMIEDLAIDRRADVGLCLPQQGVRSGKELVIRRQFVETQVLDTYQTKLF
jgi:hypothetical protein